jgi:hypothetical protein
VSNHNKPQTYFFIENFYKEEKSCLTYGQLLSRIRVYLDLERWG